MLESYHNFINNLKKVNEFKHNDSSVIFETRFDYSDIIIDNYNRDSYQYVDTATATIKFKIDVNYNKYGITDIIPYDIEVSLLVVYMDNTDDANEVEKEYVLTGCEYNIDEIEMPFSPKSLNIDLSDENAVKATVNF